MIDQQESTAGEHGTAAAPLPAASTGPSPDYRQAMRDSIGTEPWCIDHVDISEGNIEIRGWAFPPDGDPASGGFLLDGEPFPEVQFPTPRPDIERLFWYMPEPERTGFTCRAPLRRLERDILKPYALSYVDKRTARPINPLHEYYYYYPPEDRFAFPPAANRRRVHGAESESAFRLEGYTTFLKLRSLLRNRFQRDYADFRAILDWGCGCGRMTRYFNWLPACHVTGIDIDEGNIGWCQENLRFAGFSAVPLHPPTLLKNNQFDLLIGISIFTHLLERETHEWLGELQRIATPGGLLLMTIHSNTTAARANLSEPMWRQWMANGFLDAGANPDLEAQMSVQEYYRNTFFTHEYVRSNWSSYFEILDIVPGYIGNHQDVVAMRKRLS